MNHDPEEIAKGLFDKLRARARHVIFLLGAGASCAGNLPHIAALKKRVWDKLPEDQKESAERIGKERTLEEVLSRLRLISAALHDGDQRINDLTAEDARALDQRICSAISEILVDSPTEIISHKRFAQWVGQCRYDRPIEIFTTNYDLLIEKGLEAAGSPYFDGFVGILAGRFRADLIDEEMSPESVRLPAGWARLWKLHGSVSWKLHETDGVKTVTRTAVDRTSASNEFLAIYPSFQKYEESRRLPFVALSDRLRRSLAIPESLAIICGYSFGDQHINELLYDAARFYPRSEVVTLCYSDFPNDLAKKAEALPNFSALGPKEAIVGGSRGEWLRSDTETDFYKDGRFLLGDFAVLASSLGKRSPSAMSGGPPAMAL